MDLLRTIIESIADQMEIGESYRNIFPLCENVKQKRFKVKYRGCHKGYTPDSEDEQVNTVYELTMPEILHEINRDRGPDWINYDETNWQEGLDNWTFYEPINSAHMIG